MKFCSRYVYGKGAKNFLYAFYLSTGILFGLYMGAGLGGGAILGGALVSFTGIRTAYQLFAGTAFLGLIMYSVLWRLGIKNDREDHPEVRYQPVSSEDAEAVNRN